MRGRIYTLWTGSVCVVVALVLAAKTAHFESRAASATGAVIGLEPGQKAGMAPRVRFVAADGSQVEFTSAVASSPPSHRPGERVPVLYDPTDPKHAEIKGFFTLWSPAAAFGGIGVVMLGLWGLGFAMSRRETNN